LTELKLPWEQPGTTFPLARVRGQRPAPGTTLDRKTQKVAMTLKIAVPDLRRQPMDQAIKSLSEHDLTPSPGRAELTTDAVYAQAPEPGKELDPRGAVTLTPGTFVQGVQGRNSLEAAAILRSQGLTMQERATPEVRPTEDDRLDGQTQVLTQDPPQGTLVGRPGEVTVSLVRFQVPLATVPDLAGMTEAEVMRALRDARLSLGGSGVEEETTNDQSRAGPARVKAGGQRPVAGSQVRRGTPVSVTYHHYVYVPDQPPPQRSVVGFWVMKRLDQAQEYRVWFRADGTAAALEKGDWINAGTYTYRDGVLDWKTEGRVHGPVEWRNDNHFHVRQRMTDGEKTFCFQRYTPQR
jgi:beta-lactam-binding protein with PASTA domain